MTRVLSLVRIVAIAVAFDAAPTIAVAQVSPPTPVNQGGPMVIEEVQQHFFVAPEFKVSTFDGSTARFAGAHGGLLVGNGILVGGGVYTLTNGSRGRGMTYGGAVVGWQPWSAGLLGLSVRGLVGLGQATSSQTVTLVDRNGHNPVSETHNVSNDVFVAEPQMDLLVRLTKHLQLDIGGGYRLANASRFSNDHFSGASGGIALRMGSGR